MNISKKIYSLLLLSFIPIMSDGVVNLLRPYDRLLRPEIYPESTFNVALWAERGIGEAKGFSPNNDLVNVLQIWNADQNALAMLKGFSAASPITQLLDSLGALDDGTRGHLHFEGKLHLDYGGAFGVRWYFLPRTWASFSIPFYAIRLKDVTSTDLTKAITPADAQVKNLLINNLSTIAQTLGDGLQLQGWKRTGFGDANLLVESLFEFPQARPLLKNVEVDARVGFSLPTDRKTDADKLFAFSYGYDGAVGLMFGGGLNVTLGCWFKTGFDVQLIHLFGNTRERRIKTAINQTELLLLAKTDAYKDYGLIQRFSLFAQAYHIFGGLSVLAGYQFLKHGQSTLQLNSCDFSNAIANTAVSLEESILHSLEVNIHYDFNETWCNSWIDPQISLFARVPFNGKRSLGFTTVGIILAVDF